MGSKDKLGMKLRKAKGIVVFHLSHNENNSTALVFLCCVDLGNIYALTPSFSQQMKKKQLIYNKFIVPNRHLIRIIYFASCTFKNTRTTTNNKNYPKTCHSHLIMSMVGPVILCVEITAPVLIA